MTSLKNISVFRIVLLSLLSIYLNNIYIFLILLSLSILLYKKEAFFFLLLTILIYMSNNYRNDFIPIGTIEYKNNNYYVVDKILYKSKIYQDELSIGDIIITVDSKKSNSESDLKKNILFIIEDYKVLGKHLIKKKVNEYINSFNEDTVIILNKYLYNINDYDNPEYNLGFGLGSYYLLNEIRKKSKASCLLFILLYSILFSFDIKFILIILNIVFNNDKFKKEERFSYKLIIISLLNIKLFNNYSILLPLLFNLFNIYDFNIEFISYLLIIEVLLFNEINLFYTLLFVYFNKIKIYTFIFSLVILVIPTIENIFLKTMKVYSYINSINISIRGSLGILSLCLIYFIFKKYKLNTFVQSIIIILMTLIPLNSISSYVSFIDVGQGDSILISNQFNRNTVLIDTGSKYNYFKLKKYLYRKGIYKIDYLIITHEDEDHSGNISNLNNDFKINNVIDYTIDINVNDIFLKNYYSSEYDNENDNSLVYYFEKNDISFLFTADISRIVEKELIRKYENLKVDVLKASHHGSYTGNSELFISKLLPRYCIISTSGQYNHPHRETIDNLKKYLVKYYITRYDKTITFYLNRYLKLIHTDNGEFVIII